MSLTNEELDRFEREFCASEQERLAIFAQAKEANKLRSANAELRGEVEAVRRHDLAGWRGLVNINSILGGGGCDESLALGTATAQAARTMTEITRLAARVADLERTLYDALCWVSGASCDEEPWIRAAHSLLVQDIPRKGNGT